MNPNDTESEVTPVTPVMEEGDTAETVVVEETTPEVPTEEVPAEEVPTDPVVPTEASEEAQA